MAQDDGSQEKTENATPKRLREARKKGKVSKSRDMTTVVILVVCFAALGALSGYMVEEMKGFMELVFGFIKKPEIFMEDMVPLGASALMTYAKIIAPFLIAVVVSAPAVTFLQVGPVFSFEPVKPETKKLNAVENFKNMVKPIVFIELIKNILKILAIFFIAITTVKAYIEPFLRTSQAELSRSATLAGYVLMIFLVKVLIVFLMIAIIDIMLQRHEFKKNMKMTKDEVKREYKEDEGDPLIKSHRKQIYQEMAMSDVRVQVKKSDVVITNPTHIAVALKYDKEAMIAPQIMIKGQRLYAQMIREIAEEEGIPIMQNVPLAWALIDLEIEEEIPEHLYQAVAEILTFVYKLKEERERRRLPTPPPPPSPGDQARTPSRLGSQDSKYV